MGSEEELLVHVSVDTVSRKDAKAEKGAKIILHLAPFPALASLREILPRAFDGDG